MKNKRIVRRLGKITHKVGGFNVYLTIVQLSNGEFRYCLSTNTDNMQKADQEIFLTKKDLKELSSCLSAELSKPHDIDNAEVFAKEISEAKEDANKEFMKDFMQQRSSEPLSKEKW